MRGEDRLASLIDALASSAPAPASGSAAAATLAAAAALLQKVAVRSPKWEGATEAHAKAESMRIRAEELVELDSANYLAFIAALRSGERVPEARAGTLEAPREITRIAADVVSLAGELERNGNPNLRADAQASAILARAAAETADLLVRVNESAAGSGASG